MIFLAMAPDVVVPWGWHIRVFVAILPMATIIGNYLLLLVSLNSGSRALSR